MLLQGPAAALLTLDCPAKLGEHAGKARLSTLGAAMLSTLMRFDKVTKRKPPLYFPLQNTNAMLHVSVGCL